jgi:hypothetical protein
VSHTVKNKCILNLILEITKLIFNSVCSAISAQNCQPSMLNERTLLKIRKVSNSYDAVKILDNFSPFWDLSKFRLDNLE